MTLEHENPKSLSRDRLLRMGVWAHLVAVYVLFHAASILIGSIPSTDAALDRDAWDDPTVRSEFAAWADRLGWIGVSVEPETLEDAAWRFANGWSALRRMANAPFETYQRYTGTWQSWSMFVAPHLFPSRLCIDVRGDESDGHAKWRNIYTARSDEHVWRRGQFDHIRMRSAIFRFAWPQYRGQYEQFADWIADRAAVDFPDAFRVRVRFFRFKSPSPRELRDGAPIVGEDIRVVVKSLSERR